MPRSTLTVRVQPRSRTNALAGLRDGVLIVRVTAPPLDGRANDAVCELLAAVLGVRRSSLTILRGERARDKVMAIAGLDQSTADAAIAAALRGPD
jgi:uncharacterized protein